MIETEFKDFVDQINLKIEEAAMALKEANRLSVKANLGILIPSKHLNEYFETDEEEEKYINLIEKLKLIDVSSLEEEIEKAGWDTSSSYC